MDCCIITDLNSKQVINTKTGCHLGFVNDVEINTCDGRVSALIIFGRSRLLGRRDDDIRICWKDIEVIGDDIIPRSIRVAFAQPYASDEKRVFQIR